MMTIEVRGLDALTRAMALAGTRMPQVASQTVLRSAQILLRDVKLQLSKGHSGTTLGVRTGFLRNSWQAARVAPLQAITGSAAPYARIHEYGGIIRPVRAAALTFRVPGAGGAFEWRRVQQVTIPPRPYVRPAIVEATPKIRAAMHQAIRTLLQNQASRDLGGAI